MSMPVPCYAVLACDVFTEEIEELASPEPPWRSLRLLEMGLHDRPAELLNKVQQEIAGIEQDPEIEAIVLAYGRCGNGLLGVRAMRAELILPQAHDCISILLGSSARHAAILRENPGTYFYSPGWMREQRVPGPDREASLRQFYADRYPDDAELIDELIDVDREAFEHHNCAAYISIINRPVAASYCQSCAKHLGWEHKTLTGDPTFLRQLIHGNWDNPDFLKVLPGQKIGADSDGKLVAEPMP